MRLIDTDEIIKIVEYIKEQTDHKGDIFININKNAIPIEWIKEYLVKLHKEGEEERDYVINELGGYEPIYKYIYETGIKKMLEEWEKENE